MAPAEPYEGATAPIWYGDRKVYSVTGFNLGVRSRIVDLPSLWVEGEISEFRHTSRYSMVYFTLKDPRNGYLVKCTMPRARFESLGLRITDGDLVQVFGRADIYEKSGSFQLRVQSMEHAGRGLIMQQLEALAAKLQAEGLFDESRKQPLPFLPRRVGVITGAEAAAQGDFLRNIEERFPLVKLVIIETLVQGERAAPQIVAALRKLQAIDDVDVIVVTRGGGAFEDFLPFSDERVCRAIAACPTPVVSAIGHEKDSPISDLVADLRVSTPTAAARTVVPDYSVIMRSLTAARSSLGRRGAEQLARRRRDVRVLQHRLDSGSPAQVIQQRRAWVGQLAARNRQRIHGLIAQRSGWLALQLRGRSIVTNRLEAATIALGRDVRDLRRTGEVRLASFATRQTALVGRLRALGPAATLERGYAIVRRDSDAQILRSPRGMNTGDGVTITLAGGDMHATIDEQGRTS